MPQAARLLAALEKRGLERMGIKTAVAKGLVKGAKANKVLDGVQLGLGIVSMIPVVGNVASLVDAGISLARGDFVGAGLALIGAIPLVGNAFKIAKNVVKLGGKLLKGVKGLKFLRGAKLLNLKKIVTGAKKFGKFNFRKNIKIGKYAKKAKNAAKRIQQKLKCLIKGEPVDAIHGLVFYDLVDFEYPGVLPFVWERSWSSANANLGMLGHGTGCLYSMRIKLGKGTVKNLVFVNEKGREIEFATPKFGETAVNRSEKLSLVLQAAGCEVFNLETRLRYVFEGVENADDFRLARIEDETRDHCIFLDYNAESRLGGITDTAGRRFEISTNGAGLVTKVSFDGRALVKYAYDSKSNLVEAIDVNGAKSTIHYKNHLMVKRVTKNGDTFQWEYDGDDETARCIHTWGDDHLLEGWFEYEKDHTVYINSLGYREVFYFDGKKRLTKHVDAGGGETLYAYNEHDEIVSVTNPDGETTSFTYNGFGQMTEVVIPSGAAQTMEYDEASRMVKSTAPNCAEVAWEYNSSGRMVKATMPDGTETLYDYNEIGMVSKITDEVGELKLSTELEYDSSLNLTALTHPTGAKEKWEYDKHGNAVKAVSPIGSVEEMEYDRRGRLVKYTSCDGNVTYLSYNAYDDVAQLKDNVRDISLSYTPLGHLAYRKERNRKIKMSYNTEGFLTCVENENGEQYLFERDGAGDVVAEIGYDGVKKSYRFSSAGKLTGVNRGETTCWIDMQYSEDGFLKTIEYANGEVEEFTRGKMGEILSARNGCSKLEFEYDKMGRPVKETQNGLTVESIYPSNYFDLGRVGLKTSLGLSVNIYRNKYMQPEQMHANFQNLTTHQSCFAYNLLGQVLEWTVNMPNGNQIRDSWSYDKKGLPLTHVASVGNCAIRQRKYNWSSGDRIKSVIDDISNLGLEYSYDNYGVPRAVEVKGFEEKEIVRLLDDVGNVYETRKKADREYGKGGQLRTAMGREYRYDDCGDLIEKKESDGKIWQYFYHPSGLLGKVIRPDGKTVSFGYDPLGRRMSKTFNGKTTKFLWDGDKIIHEWVEVAEINRQPSEPTTWLFDEDSFTPLAKLTKEKSYGVISNHLGTPCCLLDQLGNSVWKTELDLYGRPFLREGGKVEDEKCPFRFPGQYEDEETGLYYNRFRYYDPESGMYTQRDPVGLTGGNPTVYGYVHDTNVWIDLFGLANLFQLGTYGSLNSVAHMGDGLQAHELLRHEYLVQNGITTKNLRMPSNPSIALDNAHHTRVGGAHWHEAQIRTSQGLGRNQFHANLKRELDITQGGLRKSGVPASRARKLREEAEAFYKTQARQFPLNKDPINQPTIKRAPINQAPIKY